MLIKNLFLHDEQNLKPLASWRRDIRHLLCVRVSLSLRRSRGTSFRKCGTAMRLLDKVNS